MKRKILIVTDERELFFSVQQQIENDSTAVVGAVSPSEMLARILESEFCLVILDLQLPGIEMVEMVKIIRVAKHILTLALTNPLGIAKKIELFHAGVDVFMEKPIEIAICVAQVEALTRLCRGTADNSKLLAPIIFGKILTISPRFRKILVNGERVDLTRKEFDLLHYLSLHPLQVFSCKQLYAQVWSSIFELGGEGTVKVHINVLRKKLMVSGQNMIENVRGVGYRFIPPEG